VYTLGERLGWLNTYIISLLFLVAALNLLYNIIAIHQRLKTEENRYSRKYWFGSSLNLFTNAGMIGLLLFFH
jgi:hypothetical protein